MKYTMMIAVLCCAAACVSPEEHRRLQGEKAALKAQIATTRIGRKAVLIVRRNIQLQRIVHALAVVQQHIFRLGRTAAT